MRETIHGRVSELKVMTFELERANSVSSTMDESGATLEDITEISEHWDKEISQASREKINITPKGSRIESDWIFHGWHCHLEAVPSEFWEKMIFNRD